MNYSANFRKFFVFIWIFFGVGLGIYFYREFGWSADDAEGGKLIGAIALFVVLVGLAMWFPLFIMFVVIGALSQQRAAFSYRVKHAFFLQCLFLYMLFLFENSIDLSVTHELVGIPGKFFVAYSTIICGLSFLAYIRFCYVDGVSKAFSLAAKPSVQHGLTQLLISAYSAIGALLLDLLLPFLLFSVLLSRHGCVAGGVLYELSTGFFYGVLELWDAVVTKFDPVFLWIKGSLKGGEFEKNLKDGNEVLRAIQATNEWRVFWQKIDFWNAISTTCEPDHQRLLDSLKFGPPQLTPTYPAAAPE